MEVNLITGETTILQTDIIYDCGESLNPAVDLGQVSRDTVLCLIYGLRICLGLSESYHQVHCSYSCDSKEMKLFFLGGGYCRLKELMFKELGSLCLRNTPKTQMD